MKINTEDFQLQSEDQITIDTIKTVRLFELLFIRMRQTRGDAAVVKLSNHNHVSDTKLYCRSLFTRSGRLHGFAPRPVTKRGIVLTDLLIKFFDAELIDT